MSERGREARRRPGADPGHGAERIPDVGRKAAEDNAEEIEESSGRRTWCSSTPVKDGCTGNGGDPVVARIARGLRRADDRRGHPWPFHLRGRRRARRPRTGIAQLREEGPPLTPTERSVLVHLRPGADGARRVKSADQVLLSASRDIRTDTIVYMMD